MLTALQGRHPGQRFQVVNAAVKLTDELGNSFCAIANEAIYDPSDHQKESLLSIHQSRTEGKNAVDDCSRTEHDIRGNPGTQSSRFGSDIVKFFFDGRKCYYLLSEITETELHELPRIVLTPNKIFDPSIRMHTRKMSRGASSIDWTKRLAFAPEEVITKTLQATTQLVPNIEAETRMIMRDHLKTRLPYLKTKRVNDTLYRDTFFSSITSIRGYTCFNLHCYKESALDVVYLMKRKVTARQH